MRGSKTAVQTPAPNHSDHAGGKTYSCPSDAKETTVPDSTVYRLPGAVTKAHPAPLLRQDNRNLSRQMQYTQRGPLQAPGARARAGKASPRKTEL